MKKVEKKWIQISNFLIGIEENSKGHWLVIKTVSDEWSIRYHEGSIMYGIIGNLALDEKCHKYLEAFITMLYTASCYPHDMVAVIHKQELPVINGFCKLIAEQSQYEASIAEKPTAEEDEAMLNEVAEMEEMQKIAES